VSCDDCAQTVANYNAMERRWRDARAREQRLHSDLLEYGVHKIRCAVTYDIGRGGDGEVPCDCGFNQALETVLEDSRAALAAEPAADEPKRRNVRRAIHPGVAWVTKPDAAADEPGERE